MIVDVKLNVNGYFKSSPILLLFFSSLVVEESMHDRLGVSCPEVCRDPRSALNRHHSMVIGALWWSSVFEVL